MEENSRVYRIRTKVGEDAPNVIHVPLNQTYDMFEILSLKLDQTNTYKSYESDYGVVVGRVIANGGFGIPNAKVSIFIEVDDDEDLKNKLLYNFTSTSSTDDEGIRYNLLPDFVDDACHQPVGTFPNKRLVLDNKDILEIYDKYWKYTTVTNHAGDYMIFGVPTGSQKLHVDLDLSDCGILSQRPRDMIGKGYNENMFESPNKFKSSTNLNSLVQIISQDKGLYVYPYWGDTSDGNDKFAITRCDVNVEYKFEPYAVFMGSIITDKGSDAIGKNCTATTNNGKMSHLISTEGDIEMIRKTIDGKVEEYPIMGNRLIDGDGVWCYQIPMNLDYVTTDEFGNLVPTDNPNKGIATRARVRFRFTLDEDKNDATARKRASYLVPNNPRMQDKGFLDNLDADYEFGSATRDESYCDMFWNKVYTVKNYIPKLMKNTKENNRKHTGIKLINHHEDNNPMPYNALTIKLSFTYRLICIIAKIVINLIEFINELLTMIGAIFCLLVGILDLPTKVFKEMLCIKFKVLGAKINICPFSWLGDIYHAFVSPIIYILDLITPSCIVLSGNFCDDGINKVTYYPGCGFFLFKLFEMPKNVAGINLSCVWAKTQERHDKKEKKEFGSEYPENATVPDNDVAMLYNCVENELAQSNDATSFSFYNDWVNGVLYAPLWFRKIQPKKKFFFGLFSKRAKDEWCTADKEFRGMRIIQHCTLKRREDNKFNYDNFDGVPIDYLRVQENHCGKECEKSYEQIKGVKGLIKPKLTMLGQTIYYYRAIEYDASIKSNTYLKDKVKNKKGEIKLMFATDIVLLGSLNECDMNGVPQFFKALESTTYNMPSDILFTDYEFVPTITDETDADGNKVMGRLENDDYDCVTTSEMAGCDWGNPNEFGKEDGGLFYSIGCTNIDMMARSCVNLSRTCEFGVSLDETREIPSLTMLQTADENSDTPYERLVTDGYISFDELYNLDDRSMFATMNGNRLKTKLNTNTGLREYDFRYLYPENFDGSLKEVMRDAMKRYDGDINYRNNYKLENPSVDYYKFRMGNYPYYYDNNNGFPRYENSFYFYFGLKAGKTAIEKFNAKYFAPCTNGDGISDTIGIKSKSNSWCYDEDDESTYDGYVALNLSSVTTPYTITINGNSEDITYGPFENLSDEKIAFIGQDISEKDDKGKYVTEVVENLANDGYKVIEEGNASVMFKNGSYQGEIIDGNGNIIDFTFTIGNNYLSYKINVQSFTEPNNLLKKHFPGGYKTIANNNAEGKIDEQNPTFFKRDIGGVLTLYDILWENDELLDYKITVKPKKGTKLEKEYSGIVITVKNGVATPACPNDCFLFETNNRNGYDYHSFGIGLPWGDTDYTVTVTQLCGDDKGGFNESLNSVSRTFTALGPTKYKLFINDVDVDLLKYFLTGDTGYVGYKTGIKLEGVRGIQINNYKDIYGDKFLIKLKDNPWFKLDKICLQDKFKAKVKDSNEYSDVCNVDNFYVKFADDDSNDFEILYTDIEGNKDKNDITFNEIWTEFCDIEELNNQIGKGNVVYNWCDDYFIDKYVKDEANKYYNIESFINDVNRVLQLRKALPDKVKDTFYMTCENSGKDFNFRVKTDDLPANVTVVYCDEIVDENNTSINTLKKDDRFICEVTKTIRDMRIPTITYTNSALYGQRDRNNANIPCRSEVYVDNKWYAKTPYSVGCANFNENTIPVKSSDGKDLDCTVNDAAFKDKKLNEGTVNVFQLFTFPIIDKIATGDYVAWTPFMNIPHYKKLKEDNFEIIFMHGLLGGYVYNIEPDSVNADGTPIFYTSTLNDLDILFSKNLNPDKEITYVEKYLILGNNVSEKIADLFNKYLPQLKKFLPEGTAIDDKFRQIMNFKVSNEGVAKDHKQQYAIIIPNDTTLIVRGSNGCGVSDKISGTDNIVLGENSVNDCINSKRYLEFDKEDGENYYILSYNASGYPLDSVEGSILNNEIELEYTNKAQSWNLLSYNTREKIFEDNAIFGNNLWEEISEDKVDFEIDGILFERKKNNSTTNVVYVVKTSNNGKMRTLSPVYDFQEVYSTIRVGRYITKELVAEDKEEPELDEFNNPVLDEDGNPKMRIETVYNPVDKISFKIGVAVNTDTKQLYINKLPYTISGTFKVSDEDIVTFPENKVNGMFVYTYVDTSESVYNKLKGGGFSGLATSNNLKKKITVTVKDYVGLKHISDISSFKVGDWYVAQFRCYPDNTLGFSLKVPTDGQEKEYHSSYEFTDTFANGYRPNNVFGALYYDLIPGVTTSEDGKTFQYWCEDFPDEEHTIGGALPTYGVNNEAKLYYAIFE